MCLFSGKEDINVIILIAAVLGACVGSASFTGICCCVVVIVFLRKKRNRIGKENTKTISIAPVYEEINCETNFGVYPNDAYSPGN